MLKYFLRIIIILYPVFHYLTVMYALQDTILTENSLNNSLKHVSLFKIIVEEIVVSLKDKTLSASELANILDNLTTHHFQLARGQLREVCLPGLGTLTIAVWVAHVLPYIAWAMMWFEGKVFVDTTRENFEQRMNEIDKNGEAFNLQWQIPRIFNILRTLYAITPVFAIFHIFHIDIRFNRTWPWSIGASPTPLEGFDTEFEAKISSLLGDPNLVQQVLAAVIRAAALHQSPVCGRMTAEMEKIAFLSLFLYVVTGVMIEKWFQRERCALPRVHGIKESREAARPKNVDPGLILQTQLETALDLLGDGEVLGNVGQRTEDGVLTPSSSDTEDGILTPDSSTEDGQSKNILDESDVWSRVGMANGWVDRLKQQ